MTIRLTKIINGAQFATAGAGKMDVVITATPGRLRMRKDQDNARP